VETGARDVIVVHGDRGEILLPSIPQVIRQVDLKAGIIEVELLPGLLPETEENEETR
jgi:16S rRNA processing protein RimM